MISNINQSPLRAYSSLPRSWDARPNLINYHLADPTIHEVDGWRTIVDPQYNTETQYKGSLVYDAQNDVVTYIVENYTQEQLDQRAQAAMDSDDSANKLNQAISDGSIIFQRFLAYIQRKFDKGEITGVEARNSAQLLYTPLLPLKDGQFQLAKANLNLLVPPVNVNELAILNLAKQQVNDYLNAGN